MLYYIDPLGRNKTLFWPVFHHRIQFRLCFTTKYLLGFISSHNIFFFFVFIFCLFVCLFFNHRSLYFMGLYLTTGYSFGFVSPQNIFWALFHLITFFFWGSLFFVCLFFCFFNHRSLYFLGLYLTTDSFEVFITPRNTCALWAFSLPQNTCSTT